MKLTLEAMAFFVAVTVGILPLTAPYSPFTWRKLGDGERHTGRHSVFATHGCEGGREGEADSSNTFCLLGEKENRAALGWAVDCGEEAPFFSSSET